MKTKKLLAATAIGVLFTSFSYGQTDPQILPENPKPSVEVQKPEKMQTLFSGVKNPIRKINYLGLSISPEIQLGTVAGQFTPMAGVTGMLHVNKKWGVGLAGYSTMDRGFAPTALSSNKSLSLGAMYGGLKLEYTPKPNARVHVSFPLLIGGGMARVDSVGSRDGRDGGWGDSHGGERGRFGGDNYGGNVSFIVIQPGINVEANLFRYAKLFVGASYRIVPSVMKENNTTSVLPTPSASQLGGLNLSVGLRVGLFDYSLHRTKRPRKQRNSNGSRKQ